MSVRLAVPADRGLFLTLWQSYLEEMRTKGSEILPTERTLNFYVNLFDAYVNGERPGVVAVIYPIAVSMAGDCTPDYDSTFGKQAIGWGTYVAPVARNHGNANRLREFVWGALSALGFDTLLGTTQLGDDGAAASLSRLSEVVTYQQVYYKRLAK